LKYCVKVDELSIKRYKDAIGGDLTALRIDKKIGDEELDNIAFELVEEDFYNQIGFGEKFHRLHKLRNQKALLEAEFIINDRRFNLNLIKIKEQEIKDLEQQMNTGNTIDATKVYLDKWLGYSLNMNTETVLDFYKKIEEYGRIK
jgi:hypothetical protein